MSFIGVRSKDPALSYWPAQGNVVFAYGAETGLITSTSFIKVEGGSIPRNDRKISRNVTETSAKWRCRDIHIRFVVTPRHQFEYFLLVGPPEFECVKSCILYDPLGS